MAAATQEDRGNAHAYHCCPGDQDATHAVFVTVLLWNRAAARLSDPQVYSERPSPVAALQARNTEIDNELMKAMERWEVLERRTA